MKINDIYPTIQGEGSMTGTPMFLVRTMGCDVGCDFCDTKESWYPRYTFKAFSIEDLLEKRKLNKLYWAEIDPSAIVDYISTSVYCNPYTNPGNIRGIHWILLTGGEPALQPDAVDSIVTIFHSNGFKVAIETSGARYLPPLTLSNLDWICVSPKIMHKFSNFDTVFVPFANEFKFVITNPGEDFNTVFCFLDKYSYRFRNTATISLQPVSNDPDITEKCAEICIQHGFNLSLQTHKFVNLK